MIELTPEVRNKAAQTAQSTWLMRPSGAWLAVIDAVAPLLAAYWEEQQTAYEYERDMGDDL